MVRCTSHRGCHSNLMKPGRMGPGIPGIHSVICDDEEEELPSGCAALLVPEVAETAVVPVSDEIKGKVPAFYVSLRPRLAASVDIANKVSAPVFRNWRHRAAAPRHRRSHVPQTRSGKITHRALVAISNGQDSGDVTTLANPEVVDMIKGLAK